MCPFARAAVLAGLLCSSLASAPAAAAPPDPAKLRVAADEFDVGTRAYKAGDYAEAAVHFEAADRAVPSPKALRLSLRSRAQAGHAAHAATHAAQALARYPGDADTTKLARETLEKLEPRLHKVSVSCAPPCVVSVDDRSLAGEATTRWVVYVDPGRANVSATFFGGKGAQKAVDGVAAGSSELRFEPTADEPRAKPAPAAAPPVDPVADTAVTPADAAGDGGGLHPAFFFAGLAVTAGLGGVTIWSGVDTQNDPGTEAVREQCAGQGTSCPEYQDGLAKETRTNVLIGATIGAGVITAALGVFFTDWGGGPSSAPSTGSARSPKAPSLRVSAGPLDHGGGIVTSGRF
jgi:hypothetical protein